MPFGRRTPIPLADHGTKTKPSSATPAHRKDSATPATFPFNSDPGPSAPSLGKRRRDSNASQITGIIEADEEDEIPENELAYTVIRPHKKRPKLSGEERLPQSVDGRSNSREPVNETDPKNGVSATSHPATSSTASGSTPHQPFGTPPPTTHLPDFFGASLETLSKEPFAPIDGADTIPEQVNSLFNFSFSGPATSTPIASQHTNDAFGVPTYNPVAVLDSVRAGSNHPFGGPRLVNSRARTPLSGVDRIEAQYGLPDTMMHAHMPVVDEDEYDREMGERLGIEPIVLPDDSPAPPMKKTMYGTELADDTRFGDFGRDGVASSSNFWISGRF